MQPTIKAPEYGNVAGMEKLVKPLPPAVQRAVLHMSCILLDIIKEENTPARKPRKKKEQ